MREKDVNLLCRIFAILVMLFLLAPLVVIVIASFTPTALITFPPQGFSLNGTPIFSAPPPTLWMAW